MNRLSSALFRQRRNMSSLRLANKVAVVTASTEGIGFAIAQKLASEGASVVISSRKEDNVNKAVSELKSLGHGNVFGTVCHVAKADHRQKLLKLVEDKFGVLDFLICNAGTNPTMGSVFDCSEEAWDKIFEINVKSTFLLTKESLPLLKLSKSPSVVYVTSIAGFQPIPMLGAYSVSKTALLGLTKVVANELGPQGIRVNAIAPGIVKTKFSKAITDADSDGFIQSMVALNRLSTPDEMSGTVAFLCSDDAAYITGETIIISGGMQSRL